MNKNKTRHLMPSPVRAFKSFLTKNYGLTIRGATSHLAANCFSSSWRLCLSDAYKGLSQLQEVEMVSRGHQTRPHCPFSLCQTIVSVKVMTRTGEGWSLTLTQKESNRRPRETLVNAVSEFTKHMWTGWANSHAPSRLLGRLQNWSDIGKHPSYKIFLRNCSLKSS